MPRAGSTKQESTLREPARVKPDSYSTEYTSFRLRITESAIKMAPLLNFQPATGGGRALVSVKLPIYIDTMYLEPKGQRLRQGMQEKI